MKASLFNIYCTWKVFRDSKTGAGDRHIYKSKFILLTIEREPHPAIPHPLRSDKKFADSATHISFFFLI